MCAISCIANFKDNLTKNLPYYKLLTSKISEAQTKCCSKPVWIGENAALCVSDCGSISTKICEGYQFVIAFCGELYDTAALRCELDAQGYYFTDQSDAELALNAYIHFGEKCPCRLVGSFSFVIYDAMRRQIFSASDSFSSKPLFYSRAGDSFVIASSINAILAHPDISAKVSVSGLLELLSFSRFNSGNVFEDIFMLPPANILKIRNLLLHIKGYAAGNSEHQKTCAKVIEETSGDNAGMLLLGGRGEEVLCRTLCEYHLENSRRITVYSAGTLPEYLSKFPVISKRVPVDENSVYSGLLEAVEATGLPVISDKDFLLPPMLRYASKDVDIFAALPDIPDSNTQEYDFLIKNRILFPAVSETLFSDSFSADTIINVASMIAMHRAISIKTPIFDTGRSMKPCASSCPADIKAYLKRILLEIISENNAPILAFFDRSALLRLYEGKFDLSTCSLSESELISYIIKLNMWFLKYRPSII